MSVISWRWLAGRHTGAGTAGIRRPVIELLLIVVRDELLHEGVAVRVADVFQNLPRSVRWQIGRSRS